MSKFNSQYNARISKIRDYSKIKSDVQKNALSPEQMLKTFSNKMFTFSLKPDEVMAKVNDVKPKETSVDDGATAPDLAGK